MKRPISFVISGILAAACASAQAVTVTGPTAPAGGIQPVTLDTPYQIHYFSNIGAGDSYVNIINDGARGSVGFGAAGTSNARSTTIGGRTSPDQPDIVKTATVVNVGTLCANVYVFAADEEFISCCSCPVTPDGLVSLSAQNDLVINTVQNTNLLGGTTAIVVKLLATVPTGISAQSAGTCTGSAFLAPVGTAATPPTLSNGMVAWGTGLHANTSTGSTPPPYWVTETRFVTASIDTSYSASSELNRLANLCSIYTANGTQGTGQASGAGICNACKLTGMGAASSNQ